MRTSVANKWPTTCHVANVPPGEQRLEIMHDTTSTTLCAHMVRTNWRTHIRHSIRSTERTLFVHCTDDCVRFTGNTQTRGTIFRTTKYRPISHIADAVYSAVWHPLASDRSRCQRQTPHPSPPTSACTTSSIRNTIRPAANIPYTKTIPTVNLNAIRIHVPCSPKNNRMLIMQVITFESISLGTMCMSVRRCTFFVITPRSVCELPSASGIIMPPSIARRLGATRRRWTLRLCVGLTWWAKLMHSTHVRTALHHIDACSSIRMMMIISRCA